MQKAEMSFQHEGRIIHIEMRLNIGKSYEYISSGTFPHLICTL